MAGFKMPGIPGILIGRTNDLSWGASYSFMDSIDSWVEDCREGKCRRTSKNKTEWIRFHERRELIRRKRKSPVKITFYENEHGILDGDPYVPGLYLATKWSAARGTGAKSLKAFLNLFNAKNVMEGQELLGEVELSFAWVLADREGTNSARPQGNISLLLILIRFGGSERVTYPSPPVAHCLLANE